MLNTSLKYLASAALAAVFSTNASAQSDMDALVKAARAEGQVMFYSAPVENVAKRLADAFGAKYGIKTTFVRLVSNSLLQRYAAEAEAGKIAADLFINAGDAPAFIAEAAKKGWIMSIEESGIPAVRSGEFPKRFIKAHSAVVQITPWVIAYNTNKVKGADVPKDWQDILKPKFDGQILLPDPSVSDAYLDFWTLILKKHGEKFFSDLRALNPRRYASGAQAGASLAAGEGSLFMPLTAERVEMDKARGAPIALVLPEDATGVEMQLLMTSSARAKNRNAARLFANYLLSAEGNRVLNDGPGTISVYDSARLPKHYASPAADAVKYKERIIRQLGFK